MIDSATISNFIVSNVDSDFHKKKEGHVDLVEFCEKDEPGAFPVTCLTL